MPSICYFQITSHEPEKTQSFFSQLFDWDIQKKEGPYEYWEFNTKPQLDGGVLPGALARYSEHWSDKNIPALLVYFDVKDISATLEKVKTLGGSITVDKMAIPGQGYMAVCTDDQKTVFGLWEANQKAK